MPVKSQPSTLSSAEILFLCAGFLLFFAWSETKTIVQALHLDFSRIYPQLAFSTSEYRKEIPPSELLFDQSLETFWWDEPADSGEDLFIWLEAGLSHYPGHPYLPRKLSTLVLWPGSAGNYDDYARPKRIRLTVQSQELVDVDKEYRFPEPPSQIASRVFILPDDKAPVRLPLDMIPAAQPSPAFPVNMRQLSFKIQILDYYRGKRFTNRIALREIKIEDSGMPNVR